MDWFTDLGAYVSLMPQAKAFAFDMATMPGLDPDAHGFNIMYHMQKMPETVDPYPMQG